jgi:hypothetical protein
VRRPARRRDGRDVRIGGPSWGKCECGERVWRASSAEWGRKCHKCRGKRLGKLMRKRAVVSVFNLLRDLSQ